MTILVNLHHEKCQVPIDRTTPFGNPFHIGIDGTREEVVLKYKDHFYKMLKNDEFRDKVLALKNEVLGCWCVPDLCHGHVILEYLEGTPLPIKHVKETTIEDFI